jgi:hypothetical protein
LYDFSSIPLTKVIYIYIIIIIDINFENIAPFQFINIVELNATPSMVFQVLCDENSWCKWFPGIIFL